jgi:pimeloyl-ACP methyl ester carboxylesterase
MRRLVVGLVGLCALAALGVPIVVIAVGLALASPANTLIGSAPDLPGLEAVEIVSQSGSTLHGWLISGRPGGGAVVLMHGVRSDRRSMIRRARLLHQYGFAVLLFDFQAHGESPGKRITFGHLEAMDAAAAVGFLRQREPDERVGAIGASLGGAAAVLGAQPLRLDALVLESVYPDINSALTNRLRASLGPVLGTAFTRRSAAVPDCWQCVDDHGSEAPSSWEHRR